MIHSRVAPSDHEPELQRTRTRRSRAHAAHIRVRLVVPNPATTPREGSTPAPLQGRNCTKIVQKRGGTFSSRYLLSQLRIDLLMAAA